MKAKPPQVEPKGWGDGAIKVTPIDTIRERERIKMSLSTQIHIW
jgi:hypothetical protein